VRSETETEAEADVWDVSGGKMRKGKPVAAKQGQKVQNGEDVSGLYAD
jgi:hypothetical protein